MKRQRNTTQIKEQTRNTSLSFAHEKGEKKKKQLIINLIIYTAYTNHWTNLRRAETKRKKEFNPEAWEKETSNTVSSKKKRMKERKYSTLKPGKRRPQTQ